MVNGDRRFQNSSNLYFLFAIPLPSRWPGRYSVAPNTKGSNVSGFLILYKMLIGVIIAFEGLKLTTADRCRVHVSLIYLI